LFSIKSFLINTPLQIGPTAAQISIVIYNSVNISQYFTLNTYSTSADLTIAINNLTFNQFGDNTSDILRYNVY